MKLHMKFLAIVSAQPRQAITTCGIGGDEMEKRNGVFMLVRALLLVLVLAIVSAAVKAQTASVSGTILDSSGAAVSGVSITATNTATAIDRTTVSTDTGAYTIPDLPPSLYTFIFTKTGFKTVKFADLTLTVDQVLTLDCKFEVGSISTTVEVSASAVAPIDTETATLSNVVEHNQIVDLPLILRDPYQLVLLGPGVTQSDGLGGVSVNGGRERNNNFLLDGTDNNDTEVPGGLGGLTSQNPDSTEEFRVLTNNFAPEYGRNNGAIIDVITRSGTNNYHGDLFYFGRWDALGARDYFNHETDPLTGDIAAKNPYTRNLYGGSIGGPVIKDKTFFFINYQGDRFVTSLTNVSTVPTAAFKSGVFTYTNPSTGATQSLNVTGGGANNATTSGLDSSIQQVLAFYPAPTINNSDGITGLLFFPTQSREKDEDATMKVDQKIGKNNDLYVRYVYNYFHDPDPFHSDELPGQLGAISEGAKSQGLAVGLTTVFGSSLTNEARFGANRLNTGFFCTGVPTFDSITGNNGSFVDSQGNGADFGPPGFTGFGCQGLGDSNGQSRHTGTYSETDYMTKVKGSHTIKFGGEFRQIYSNNATNFSSRAAFNLALPADVGVSILQNLNPGIDNLTLEDEVSGLLGLVGQQGQSQYFSLAGARRPTDELNFRQREIGLFAQDIWKVKSNLSITYGVRWEYYDVPFEAHGNLSNFFGDASGPAPNGFTFTPVGPGTGHQLYPDYYKNFDPRVGFAWDPFKTGRTSVRGGFGVFSDRVFGNLVSDVKGNPPFEPFFSNQPFGNTGTGPGSQVQNQVPPSQLIPSAVVTDGTAFFPDIFSQDIKPLFLSTWNLGIQREITTNLVVDANYVGNRGTRILRVVDSNPPQPALVSQLEAFCVPTNPANTFGCTQSTLQFASLYFGQEFGQLPFDAVNNNAFEAFGGPGTFNDQSSGESTYNGLQLQVTERDFHGLRVQLAYTYSHAFDDSSDPLATTAGNGNFPINSNDLRRERGNSGFDTRHRAVVNFTYHVNAGRGKAHFSEGVVGRVLEGWELSGIAAFQTGLPYDIIGTADTLHTANPDRATLVDPGALKTTPAQGKVVPSTAVFTGENPGAFNPDDPTVMPVPFGIPSNVGRNHFYGPGINNWDFNFAKNTSITERFKLQLRFEFYNMFNRTQFAKPVNTIGNPNFGYSLSQVGQNDGTTGARQVQIGAKLQF
jgi:Carboxypeptidase regulatory-like domain/TonB dependent receptor